jgi:glycine cleavage system H protein
MNVPESLRYTAQHEWIRPAGGSATMGITDYAQQSLSDITFVELPPVGRTVGRGEELGAIESCKAAASVYAPVGGEVTEVNRALEDDPGLVNRDPYGEGWICKLVVADPGELESLLTAEQYRPLCQE